MQRTILLTGATGYIGRRLEQRLREREDVSLRLFVRDARKLTGETRQRAEVFEGDAMCLPDLRRALAGVDTAFYLIRAGEDGQDFPHPDRISAENFLQACLDQGVRTIVHLGGPTHADAASLQADTHNSPGRILSSRPDRIRTIWFRTGVVIGSGSASFEMIRCLLKRSMAVFAARWAATPVRPIGIDDVTAYLTAALAPAPDGTMAAVDIGAPPMTFLDMLRQTARVMNLRRLILPAPFSGSCLSSLWLALMTPVPYRMAAAFVKSLQSESRNQIIDYAGTCFPGIRPASFPHAVRQAIHEAENDLVLSRWCDSGASALGDIDVRCHAEASILRDRRAHSLAGTAPERVFASLLGIGGENGWLASMFLWRLRGWLDKAVGGCGLNRGRRHATELRIGDALDFWRVVDLVPNKRLLLQAEMRLPGKAWLEFDLQQDTLVQTAHFVPHGLPGRLYWYAVFPFHNLIFPKLCRAIVARAESGRFPPPPKPESSDSRALSAGQSDRHIREEHTTPFN